MAGRSQALAFGELLAGGVMLTAGIKGQSIRDVLAGRGSPIRPLVSESPTGQTTPGATATTAALGRLGAGGYHNPFPASSWTIGRTDQGVDFAYKHPGAPILAPGNAKVVKLGAPGWPGGGGVLLHLLDGTFAGRYVFIYEGLRPQVRVGQIVRAGEQIATGAITGSIEIGFADAAGVPLSHAGYTEGEQTTWGKRMRAFLQSLGGRGS